MTIGAFEAGQTSVLELLSARLVTLRVTRPEVALELVKAIRFGRVPLGLFKLFFG